MRLPLGARVDFVAAGAAPRELRKQGSRFSEASAPAAPGQLDRVGDVLSSRALAAWLVPKLCLELCRMLQIRQMSNRPDLPFLYGGGPPSPFRPFARLASGE